MKDVISFALAFVAGAIIAHITDAKLLGFCALMMASLSGYATAWRGKTHP